MGAKTSCTNLRKVYPSFPGQGTILQLRLDFLYLKNELTKAWALHPDGEVLVTMK
jgi:hypothetical protein